MSKYTKVNIVESKFPPVNKNDWWYNEKDSRLKRYQGGDWINAVGGADTYSAPPEDAPVIKTTYKEAKALYESGNMKSGVYYEFNYHHHIEDFNSSTRIVNNFDIKIYIDNNNNLKAIWSEDMINAVADYQFNAPYITFNIGYLDPLGGGSSSTEIFQKYSLVYIDSIPLDVICKQLDSLGIKYFVPTGYEDCIAILNSIICYVETAYYYFQALVCDTGHLIVLQENSCISRDLNVVTKFEDDPITGQVVKLDIRETGYLYNIHYEGYNCLDVYIICNHNRLINGVVFCSDGEDYFQAFCDINNDLYHHIISPGLVETGYIENCNFIDSGNLPFEIYAIGLTYNNEDGDFPTIYHFIVGDLLRNQEVGYMDIQSLVDDPDSEYFNLYHTLIDMIDIHTGI